MEVNFPWFEASILVGLKALYTAFDATYDIILDKYNISIFKKFKNQQWFNPKISWINKWKKGKEGIKERWFTSSTITVFLSDFRHFLKASKVIGLLLIVMLSMSLFGALNGILQYSIAILIYLLVHLGVFELFYKKLLIDKKFRK